METMTIGRLAAQAGVGVETIRYYQRRGLLARPTADNGAYRRYGADDLARLRFIRHAQTLGFSLEEAGELLALDEEQDREKARTLARAKIAMVEARLQQLQEMRDALRALVHCCEHTEAPAPCPILHALADSTQLPAPRT